jgi:uncharacterized protein (DUF427 family)
MGLMTGTGPLGRKPAGTFNFEPPPPGRALYLEPTPKRIRVLVGGETVADSSRAMLLHESGHQPIYYFPPEDVRAEFLESSDRHTHCPKKGEASYYTIRVGDQALDAGAWYYPDPLPDAPPIKDLIAFYFNRMDHWLEEDEEVRVHPRDPYHRIDVLRSGGEDVKDLVWCYADPFPEVGRVAGLVCFFNERVEIELDGALQEQPESPWSHGVKSDAQNAPPAQTI